MSIEETTERAVRAATRMYLADRPQVALDYLTDALSADPACYEALVMVGDIYARWAAELGLEDRRGNRLALGYFDRAIAVRPDHAEAYAEKCLALLHLDDFEATLQTAERGLPLFDQHPTLDEPHDVWVNIGESLYRARALALLESGLPAAGSQVLDEGLARFTGSH